MLKKYFSELKNRFLLILFAWFSTIIVCYHYKETLLFLLIKVNYSWYNSDIFYFIATSITDVVAVYFNLSYFITNQLIIFFSLYHCLIFFSPALYSYEYNILKFIFRLYLAINIFNVWFFNQIILPFICFFFLNYQNINVFFEARINDYFKFYSTLYFLILGVFYFFSLIYLFFSFINNKLNYVKSFRKLLYLTFFLISTIITPPDIFSQIFFGVFCICFYEFTMIIIIINFFTKKAAK